MMNDGISVADALALRNTGSNNNGAFGDNGAWWVIILILFFAVGGWNRNNGSTDSTVTGYTSCCTPATSQGISDAFNFNQLDNGIRAIQNGLCDGFYAMANNLNGVQATFKDCCCQTQTGMLNGFNGVQTAISANGYQTQQGFNGVERSICDVNFGVQSGFNALGSQLAAIGCELNRGQENIKYALANATNQIVVENDKNTDRIINYLTQNEMDKLRTDLQAANFQLSQQAQTSNIVNQLLPVAKPAYLTCSPYAAAFGTCQNTCGCA